uniref:Uncharacterized protein n=1 Tax=Ditylenchus dipsaci TaxID=166011 RepID=A0A915DB17_9BILA
MEENSDKSNSEKTNSKELSERNKDKTNSNEVSERVRQEERRIRRTAFWFADDEWQDSAPAFDPELINVKANTRKPSVFQASHLIVEKEKPTTALEKSPIVLTSSVTTLATLIGRLLADVVRLYLQGKQDQDVQVELSLIQKNSVAASASYSSPLPETKVLDFFTGSPSSTSSSAETTGDEKKTVTKNSSSDASL